LTNSGGFRLNFLLALLSICRRWKGMQAIDLETKKNNIKLQSVSGTMDLLCGWSTLLPFTVVWWESEK